MGQWCHSIVPHSFKPRSLEPCMMGAVFKNTLLLKTTNYMKFHNNISDVMTGYSESFAPAE